MNYAHYRPIRSVSIILTLLLFASLSAVVSAQANKVKFEAEIRAIYPKLEIALKTKDLKKLTAYYDEKYTLFSDGKTLERAGAIDQWKSVLEFLRSVDKLTTRISKITLID